MTEQISPLTTFYKGWENHQQALVKIIASLSFEQLALPPAAHHRSIGELLAHMIDARLSWFSSWMGEGSSDLAHWNDDEQAMHRITELVTMFEETWHVIFSALTRWTSSDLKQLISPPASHQAWLQKHGFEEEPAYTRQWIIWHVMEHEIHHGGKLSLALGMNGVDSFYTW